MDITRVYTRGGTQFACAITDGDASYNVFIEALGNNVILPELIASGWKLTGLPLVLSKNGVALTDYPTIEWSPTAEEEQELFDRMGTPLPMEDRRKLLSENSGAAPIKQAAGDYSITTREEFLQYLTVTHGQKNPNDFLPINYFVSPNALFTLGEFISPQFGKYVNMLAARRHFTPTQWQSLITFLHGHGLPEVYTSDDVTQCYFQWGIDGLNLPPVSQPVKQERYLMIDVPPAMGAMDDGYRTVWDEVYAGVDYAQQLYADPKYAGWQVANTVAANREAKRLKPGELAPVQIRKRGSEVRLYYNTNGPDVYIMPRKVYLANTCASPALQPTLFAEYTPHRMLGSDKYKEMLEDAALWSMAEEYNSRRKDTKDYSSYQALLAQGFSPLAAIKYIRDYEYTISEGVANEEDKLLSVQDYPRNEEIAAWLADPEAFEASGAESDPAESEALYRKIEFMNSIVDGSENCATIQQGKDADAAYKAVDVYKQLRLLHDTCGLSFQEVYNTLEEQGWVGAKFEWNGKTVTLDPSPIDNTRAAYNKESLEIRDYLADKSYYLIWVTEVARELGDCETSRHVGVKYVWFDKDDKWVKNKLNDLKQEYMRFITSKFESTQAQERFAKYANIVAASSLMQGTMQMVYTYPAELQAPPKVLSMQEQAEWKSHLKGPAVMDTMTMCDAIYICNWVYQSTAFGAVNEPTSSAVNYYCVNAVITPFEVKPRYGYNIPVSYLSALYFDLRQHPRLPELVKKRLIYQASDVGWSLLDLNGIFNDDEITMGIRNYYERSAALLQSCHGHTLGIVPHPAEIVYPDMYPQESRAPTPTDEPRKWFLLDGTGGVLGYKPHVVETKERLPIYPYRFMPAKAFLDISPDFMFPTNVNKEGLMVSAGSSIVSKDRVFNPADVRNMDPNKFPIARVTEYIYLLMDAQNTLWVVEV